MKRKTEQQKSTGETEETDWFCLLPLHTVLGSCDFYSRLRILSMIAIFSCTDWLRVDQIIRSGRSRPAGSRMEIPVRDSVFILASVAKESGMPGTITVSVKLYPVALRAFDGSQFKTFDPLCGSFQLFLFVFRNDPVAVFLSFRTAIHYPTPQYKNNNYQDRSIRCRCTGRSEAC